jgi:hypothetical protein
VIKTSKIIFFINEIHKTPLEFIKAYPTHVFHEDRGNKTYSAMVE